MCNLSEGIEERAAERATAKATENTTKRIIVNMFENKFSISQIALATGKKADEIERIIKENKPVLV